MAAEDGSRPRMDRGRGWIADGAMGEAVVIVAAMAMDGAMVINAAVAIDGVAQDRSVEEEDGWQLRMDRRWSHG